MKKKKHKIKQNKINFYKKSKYIYSEILGKKKLLGS